MLHVLLMILKITGIIIAVLLGIIIALLLIVLFVPVRYIVDARADASAEDKISGIIRFNWLLHIINGYIRYGDGETDYRIRIFLFRYRDSSQEEDDEYEEDEPDYKVRSNADAGSRKQASVSQKSVHDRKENVTSSTESKKPALPESEGPKDEDVSSNEKTTWFVRLKESLQRITAGIRQFFESAASLVTGTEEKVKSFFEKVSEKIEYFNTEINTPENKELIKFLIKETKKVLWNIRPRRYIVKIKYGAESPDITGQVTGYVAAANAFFNLNINYTPSFDEEALEGSFYGKGHIMLFPLLWIAFIVYRDKQFKKMFKKFR